MLSSEAPGARKRGPPAAAAAPPTLSDLEAEPMSVEPAAKKPARRYASRGAGFSGQETAALLALLQAQLPVSKDEWEAIARMHAVRFPTLNRTADTLRRKFARLNQSSRADDQPRVSREAKLARAIHSAINKRSQFGDDGAGPPVDLIDPLGSEHDATEQLDDDEDDQPLTMQQPPPQRPQQQLEQQAQVQQIPMAPVRTPPVPEQQPSQQQRQALPATATTPSLHAAAANSACSTCHANASKWDELLVMMRVSMLAMQQQREQDAADRRRRDEEERARREEDRRRWEEQRESDRERSQRLLDAMAQTHKTIELLVAAVVTNQRRE